MKLTLSRPGNRKAEPSRTLLLEITLTFPATFAVVSCHLSCDFIITTIINTPMRTKLYLECAATGKASKQ